MEARLMTAATPFRLLIDGPSPGAWNMAVDEMLLDAATEQEGGCLRFYRWQEPTLSLGYFQAYDQRHQHAASLACPVVRRLTGGGAILHDVELTYSIILPGRHRLAAQRNTLYEAAHGCLIESLGDLAITATLQGDGERKAEKGRAVLVFSASCAGRRVDRRHEDRRQRAASSSRRHSATRQFVIGPIGRGAGTAWVE